MTDKFYCPSAIQQGGGPNSPFKPPFNGEAQWDTEKDGSHTCSYCGSLHPDDFLDIMQRYAAGEEGYRFSTTSKGYKAYGNRPGVKNAMEGGIKFYGWHIPAEPEAEAAHMAAFRAAALRLQQEFRAMHGGPEGEE